AEAAASALRSRELDRRVVAARERYQARVAKLGRAPCVADMNRYSQGL
ncbi:hypothetical protein KIPB_013175, partial [Kipferlia bialata]